MMKLVNEFKAFALRGNVVDMAVGIVIGAAFTSIVTSLVNDIIMPPIGYVTGGMDFSDIAITLREAEGDTPAVAIAIGRFINAVISFAIVAWVLFMIIKGMNALKTKEAEKPAEPAKDPKDVVLLQEIRDILAGQPKPPAV
jgi:large conductance mechanosensitive channel